MHTFLVVSIEPVVYENKKLGKSARTISSGDKLSFEWTFFWLKTKSWVNLQETFPVGTKYIKHFMTKT
jgi:hypothetical protein